MLKSLGNSNFLIVGLARDCETKIEATCDVLFNAFAGSATLRFLIIESDSSDQTLEKLKRLMSKYDIEYKSLGQLRKKHPKRTERMAICRNEYLKEIRENPIYQDIDYVVVADFDGVNLGLTQEAVATCWEMPVKWDACFANQNAPYYDIWALRHDLWCSIDCFEQERFLKEHGVDHFLSRYISVLSKMIRISEYDEPIKVQSAFGGLGIYKKEKILNGEYRGIDPYGREVCEHVPLHLDFFKNAHLYINPRLVNGGWNEHSRWRQSFILGVLYLLTRALPMSVLIFIGKSLRR